MRNSGRKGRQVKRMKLADEDDESGKMAKRMRGENWKAGGRGDEEYFERALGIEREIASLQLEEKRLVAEIKRTAKTGNEAATKILARQLVRLRQQIANLQGSRAQMRGIATHTQAMHANTSVANGMKSASKAMQTMNKQMAPAKQMKAIQEFQKQSAQLDMTSEMMSESLDSVLDEDEAEEETEELTNQVGMRYLTYSSHFQVLDEIGVDVASQDPLCFKKAESGGSVTINSCLQLQKGELLGKRVRMLEASHSCEEEKLVILVFLSTWFLDSSARPLTKKIERSNGPVSGMLKWQSKPVQAKLADSHGLWTLFADGRYYVGWLTI
ncbi:hypothetical protein ACLOJK_009668 [Asimina triloba]